MADDTPYGRREASVEYWSTHRCSLEELYPSEEHFFVDCLKQSNSVLDVGCAAGGFSDICRAVVPAVEYTGLDVSSNLVQAAREKYSGAGNEFHVYDGARFPPEIGARKFDTVYSFGVLHHVRHWDRIVRQMLDSASAFVCFDLRLSYAGNVDGYQVIDFNEEWDGSTKIDYCVLDFFDTVKTIHAMTGDKDNLELYGYKCSPTDKAAVDIDEVVMASFCVYKDGSGPGLAIEIR